MAFLTFVLCATGAAAILYAAYFWRRMRFLLSFVLGAYGVIAIIVGLAVYAFR